LKEEGVASGIQLHSDPLVSQLIPARITDEEVAAFLLLSLVILTHGASSLRHGLSTMKQYPEIKYNGFRFSLQEAKKSGVRAFRFTRLGALVVQVTTV
jgi:hypothetical protein